MVCLAVGHSDSALANCSAAAGSHVIGTPIKGLSRADDAAASIELPFPITMYGTHYTSAVVSSNGWVALGARGGAREPCSADGAWPGAACLGTGPILAPFWGE